MSGLQGIHVEAVEHPFLIEEDPGVCRFEEPLARHVLTERRASMEALPFFDDPRSRDLAAYRRIAIPLDGQLKDWALVSLRAPLVALRALASEEVQSFLFFSAQVKDHRVDKEGLFALKLKVFEASRFSIESGFEVEAFEALGVGILISIAEDHKEVVPLDERRVLESSSTQGRKLEALGQQLPVFTQSKLDENVGFAFRVGHYLGTPCQYEHRTLVDSMREVLETIVGFEYFLDLVLCDHKLIDPVTLVVHPCH